MGIFEIYLDGDNLVDMSESAHWSVVYPIHTLSWGQTLHYWANMGLKSGTTLVWRRLKSQWGKS